MEPDKDKYRIKWGGGEVVGEGEPNKGIYDNLEECLADFRQLDFMQPENRYFIETCKDGEWVEVDVGTIDKDAKTLYIESCGAFCPFCHSNQIEGTEITIEEGKAFQEMSCVDCNKTWTDIYTLTNIEEVASKAR